MLTINKYVSDNDTGIVLNFTNLDITSESFLNNSLFNKWPILKEQYVEKIKDLTPGAMYPIRVTKDLIVYNCVIFATKENDKIYQALRETLGWLDMVVAIKKKGALITNPIYISMAGLTNGILDWEICKGMLLDVEDVFGIEFFVGI